MKTLEAIAVPSAQALIRQAGHMTDSKDLQGRAALTICESLLLALNDHHLLPESDVVGILADAAITHENAAADGKDSDVNLAVAALIRKIIAGGNSVRRP